MSERFTIELSEEQAQMMREIAHLAKQPIENIITEMLQYPSVSRETIDTQLQQINSFSTVRLWALVHAGLGFPPDLDARMLELIQKSKVGTISEDEQGELDELIVIYDKFVLLRTEALVELQERGYDVQSYLKANAPQS